MIIPIFSAESIRITLVAVKTFWIRKNFFTNAWWAH